MTYSFSGFGADEALWSDGLSDEVKKKLAIWIAAAAARGRLGIDFSVFLEQARAESRATGSSPLLIPARTNSLIVTAFTRSVADGGGIVVGSECNCPVVSGPTTTLSSSLSASVPCLAGTGGVPVPAPVVTGRVEPPKVMVRGGAPSGASGVSGRIVGAGGVGVAGATVSLAPPGGGMVRPVTATTDAAGVFSIMKAPGTYDLTVRAAGMVDAAMTGVVVAAGRVTRMGDIPVVPVGVDPCVDPANMWMEECGGDGVPPCLAGQVRLADGTCGEEPAVCPPGQVILADGTCGCPAGQVLQADGTCGEEGEEKGEAPAAWYKSPWLWGGVAVLAIGGIWLATRKG